MKLDKTLTFIIVAATIAAASVVIFITGVFDLQTADWFIGIFSIVVGMICIMGCIGIFDILLLSNE